MKLLLASSSPRRAEVLRDAGIAFEICAARQVDETAHPGETARAMVARLAEAKARAAAQQYSCGLQVEPAPVDGTGDCIVVGADTSVELDGEIFGKPRDAAHAREMLTALGGRTHQVLTGIFLLRLPDGASLATVETTSVAFAPLDRSEIETYVAGGEPMDKAGAYAIQGVAGRYITRIEGCYFNVVGLPLARLHAMLRDLGWPDKK
jgi:septum formation protein